MGEYGSKIAVYTFLYMYLIHSTVSRSIKEVGGITTQRPKFRSRIQGGYGEIGRRYGLDWIEPWYGLSDHFQIQRNPGMTNGQS
jgi:uncharacterized protein with beta-barrel porin domain